MRRRLDFVIPDTQTARQIEDELLLARIEERYMHFLAKSDDQLKDLPRATLSLKMDFEHGLQLGATVGAVVGLVFGLVVYFGLDLGVRLSFGALLLLALLGAVVGALSSALVGSSLPNTRLRQFANALEDGHILLMVDVPVDRIDEITALVKKHHPEVEDHGAEPIYRPFP